MSGQHNNGFATSSLTPAQQQQANAAHFRALQAQQAAVIQHSRGARANTSILHQPGQQPGATNAFQSQASSGQQPGAMNPFQSQAPPLGGMNHFQPQAPAGQQSGAMNPFQPQAPASAPQNMNPALNAFRVGINAPVVAAPHAQDDDDDDSESESEDEEEPFVAEDSNALSRINIIIRSPIVISGNSNLIACDAAATANAIALGVVQSLRQLSMGQHGIPMIDEQGRPRPLGVEVIAEMRVEGSLNVVGERAVLARMLDLKEKVAQRKVEVAKEAAREYGCRLIGKSGHVHGPDCAVNTPAAPDSDSESEGDSIEGANGNSSKPKVKVENKRSREDNGDVNEGDAKRSRNF